MKTTRGPRALRGLGSTYAPALRRQLLKRPKRSYSTPSDTSGGGPLAKVLRDSIKATGPIRVSQYMQWCLSHPIHGYYQQGDVFGEKGDFITSPEISQIFGELIAVWLVTRYIAAGKPERCRILELGPGRGTLMADVLRAFSQLQGISKSIKSVHLVENSEKMQKVQEENIGRMCAERDIEVHWVDRIDDVQPSDEFTLIIAHEFFDAMPIDVFEKTEAGFREVMVDLDPEFTASPSSSTPSGLRLSISRDTNLRSKLLPSTSARFAALPLGGRVEIAHDSWKIARKLGELIAPPTGQGGSQTGGGAGLIVDYGAERLFSDSFRAIKQHKIIEIFDEPGTADLTANVDFAYLEEAISGTGTSTFGPISQGQFLVSLGLQPRLQKLISSTSPERREDLTKGAQRLVDPLFMGSQYQVMGLLSGAGEEGEVYPFPQVTALGGDTASAEKTVS